jgi:hypothetical protein
MEKVDINRESGKRVVFIGSWREKVMRGGFTKNPLLSGRRACLKVTREAAASQLPRLACPASHSLPTAQGLLGTVLKTLIKTQY